MRTNSVRKLCTYLLDIFDVFNFKIYKLLKIKLHLCYFNMLYVCMERNKISYSVQRRTLKLDSRQRNFKCIFDGATPIPCGMIVLI